MAVSDTRESDLASRRGEENPAPHRWGLGAFLLVEAVLLTSAALIGAVLRSEPSRGPMPVWDVLIATVAPAGIAAAVAVAITVVRGNGPRVDLRMWWRRADVLIGLRFGAAGLVCTTIAAVIWTEVVGEDNATSAIGALLEDRSMSVAAAVSMFVYLWLVAPVFEEIIYRGLLWGAVERLRWGSRRWARIAAFAVSTAVFALSHLEPMRTVLLLVIAVPIGLARLRTGRLLGSIVAHQVNNFLPALAILLTGLGVMAF